jgi:hypothetical protein
MWFHESAKKSLAATMRIEANRVSATASGLSEGGERVECEYKRATELQGKVGAPFEHDDRYQHLSRRQNEIEENLDLTKNQAPSPHS